MHCSSGCGGGGGGDGGGNGDGGGDGGGGGGGGLTLTALDGCRRALNGAALAAFGFLRFPSV